MKNNNILEELKSFLASDEGKKSITDFKNKYEREDRIENYHLQKFHDQYSSHFSDTVEKLIVKYASDKYYYRWINRGIEPPEPLFHFLFSYAAKFGRECTKEEWEEHGNSFTGGLYYVNGYYFNLMFGQGSVVKIIKK